MDEKDKKIFVDAIRKELIEEEHLYLSEEFADDSSEFMVDALEKQIPKKVVREYDDGIKENLCCCPICRGGIGWEHNKHVYYCSNCGQKLNWGKLETSISNNCKDCIYQKKQMHEYKNGMTGVITICSKYNKQLFYYGTDIPKPNCKLNCFKEKYE